MMLLSYNAYTDIRLGHMHGQDHDFTDQPIRYSADEWLDHDRRPLSEESAVCVQRRNAR
jgi:hypothetical protein